MVRDFFYNRWIDEALNDRSVWEDSLLKKRLAHYYSLLYESDSENSLYLICKHIPVEFDPESSDETLWNLHSEINSFVLSHLNDLVSLDLEQIPFYVSERARFTREKSAAVRTYMDLKVELAKRMLNSCEFCELKCGVNRLQGQKGKCGVGADGYYSSAFIHLGEERPLIPSGTIFFAGCNFSCVFCQNEDISLAGKEYPLEMAGMKVNPNRLKSIAENLVKKGARNLNWVGGDPIPNLHLILDTLNRMDLNICNIWNSNFYNSQKSLELLIDVIDLWLPDFKYGNDDCGLKYSGIPNYWKVIIRNMKYIAEKGTRCIIIRHLVMPGHLKCCSFPILEWIAKNIGNVALVNIMGQYHPANKVSADNFREINRRPLRTEMNDVYQFADKMGVEYRSVSF